MKFVEVEQLAIAGNADAQCALGGIYDHGLEGVTKDYQEAVKWYRKAADQGHKTAQFCLGICYQIGKYVNKNNEESAKWYRKAASQGHAEAKKALDWLISEGLISTAPSSTSSYTPPKSASASASDLTGSSWHRVINCSPDSWTYTFKENGILLYTGNNKTKHTWSRNGNSVTLKQDDNYYTIELQLIDPDTMEGTFSNVDGFSCKACFKRGKGTLL